MSAINGGRHLPQRTVSSSVALVGTGLRRLRNEYHHRCGWRTVERDSVAGSTTGGLSVCDAL